MENRDIRIAFFDIDGTLLPPDHHLPESTVAALNILRAKGVQLYLATGRPPYHLHYLKKDLPFEFDGMVMMNGQYCRDKDGCFYAHPLPQEGLRELLPWLDPLLQGTLPGFRGPALHLEVTAADVRCDHQELLRGEARRRSVPHLLCIHHAMSCEEGRVWL